MLLRKLTQHVQDQNWFAVVLDFFIVVIGVFIGIQVANWNDVQQDKAGLAASLERLDKELVQNLDMIERVLVNFEEGQADLDLGRDALNACAGSPEAVAALERSFFAFVEDVQPNFVDFALNQLARHDRHLALLSPQFQDDFRFYAGRLKEESEQLTSHYDNMWSHNVVRHPGISAYFSADSETYEGWGFALDRPFEAMCADASFRNRYINTIGFYTSINNRLIRFREDAERFQSALRNERERN
ncbi:MAG: hypothetical protein V2I57_13875 [Xanthomonadales bacterium]|jgi:hypothetical protein|nr:hypothetical protein [Xanthomonadales bacterium]